MRTHKEGAMMRHHGWWGTIVITRSTLVAPTLFAYNNLVIRWNFINTWNWTSTVASRMTTLITVWKNRNDEIFLKIPIYNCEKIDVKKSKWQSVNTEISLRMLYREIIGSIFFRKYFFIIYSGSRIDLFVSK